jgi:predicted permease
LFTKKIVGTVVLGAISSWIGVFDNAFVVDATKFVFWVALPALVINGIGVGIDFYSDAFVWDFIKVFLLIRVASLLLSFFLVIAVFRERKGIGDVAVQFLNFSWISTIVHGSKWIVYDAVHVC